MDFSGVDFGFANLDFSNMDLRDSQGRYPMDPGYDPAPAANTNGTIYSQVETEVSRVTNADGTVTITYRGSTDPNAPTYTRTTGTATTTTDPGVVTYEGSGAGRVKITTYKDGRVVREASPEGSDEEDPVAKQMRLDRENSAAIAAADKLKNRQNAYSTIKSVLSDYGLSGLTEYAWQNIIATESVNINNPDAIIYALKEQPVYKERFKANEARKAKGLAELDPASYLALEDSYRTTMQLNGLPEGFYDNLSDFQALIEGDVSPGELQSRVKDGFAAVAQADPTVKRQMQELYGISEGQLAAHFLDPTKAAPLLKQQATAANIAARGKEMAGIQLTALSAQDLVERGYTADQAATAFGKLGKLGELTQTLTGEKDITQSQQIGNAFGYDTQAAMDLEQRKRRRVAQFEGGGSFARTQGQTSGSISTSIGKAQ